MHFCLWNFHNFNFKRFNLHSCTPFGKSFPQNIVANPNKIRNVSPLVEGEGKYLESLGKPDKENTVINHNKKKYKKIKRNKK